MEYFTGEPLNKEVINKWEAATGLVVKEGYGQTETTLLLAGFKVVENRQRNEKVLFENLEYEQGVEARVHWKGCSWL